MGKHKLEDEELPHVRKKQVKVESMDQSFEHLCDTIDLSPRSRRFLTTQSITDVRTLVSKMAVLEQTALPDINKSTQRQLHKFCQWYRDFYKEHGEDVDWTTSFTEDSLNGLEKKQLEAAASNSSNGVLDDDLEFVCDKIEVSKRSRLLLAQNGIKCVEGLRARQTDLEMFSLKGINSVLQKTLLKTCLWIEDFYRKNDSTILWRERFNDKGLAEFEPESTTERDYRSTLDRIHEGLGDGGIGKVDDNVCEYAATITTRYLSRQLVRQCKEKFQPFNVAFKCAKALMHPTAKPNDTIHLVAGKTQSGKSTVKAVCAAVHRQLNCQLIVITKGIPERDDLQIKLNKLLGGSRETMEAGLLVIADTGAQLAKAIRVVNEKRRDVPYARFGIIVDEADAMYRTAGGIQVMEQRFAELMDLGPSFRMEISATIFSALQALEEQEKQVELMEILTTKDYSGIDEMERFSNKYGRPVSLLAKDINWRTGTVYSKEAHIHNKIMKKEERETKARHPILFRDDCALSPNCCACNEGRGCEKHTDVLSRSWDLGTAKPKYIPYTSEPMMDMLEERLKAKKKGELILVATNPRVYANYNVMIQANCVQNHFRSQGYDMAMLVATGRGMELRLPGFTRGRFVRRKLKTVSDIIEQVDKEVGLEVPIIIFGYSRMCRCVSFRSSGRVPTAMILTRGPGYSLEDYIQALGRATFNGLSVLQQNGHNAVEILTNENDFAAAKKYYVFVQEICRLLNNNEDMSPLDALRRAEERLPDEANFFRHTNRKIGRRKDLKGKGPSQEYFVDPSDFTESESKRKRYWDDPVAQKVFRLFVELSDDEDTFCCSLEHLLEEYNNNYDLEGDDEKCLKKGELKKKMAELERDVLFVRTDCVDDGTVEWSAKHLKEIEYLTNNTIDDEPSDLDDLDDRNGLYY